MKAVKAVEVMRSLLTDAVVGATARADRDPDRTLHHVEDERANPDVPSFAACTVVFESGRKARLTVALASRRRPP